MYVYVNVYVFLNIYVYLHVYVFFNMHVYVHVYVFFPDCLVWLVLVWGGYE